MVSVLGMNRQIHNWVKSWRNIKVYCEILTKSYTSINHLYIEGLRDDDKIKEWQWPKLQKKAKLLTDRLSKLYSN